MTKKIENYWRKFSSPNEILNKYKNMNFFDISFKEIDKLLEEKCEEIKCSEVSALYAKYFCDLKRIKSNATSCPIFSELLITRLTLHYINKKYIKFKKEAVPCNQSKDLLRFESTDGKYGLATECIPKELWNIPKGNSLHIKPKTVDEKKRQGHEKPDNVIFQINPPKLIGAIATKSFTNDFDSDLEFGERLNKYTYLPEFDGAKHLIIVIGELPKEQPRYLLHKRSSSVCYLWNNPENFSKLLDEELDLGRKFQP